ncbi:hypothetical protein [Aureivirga sp. CE67]|uniref:hypothetical protein n=1 Tax=Aureivirga sp. CE67 TaxID=1788983 RepID=UPI0018CB9EC9|nr:hypothetical protein [Aureivirga sp. CE67]
MRKIKNLNILFFIFFCFNTASAEVLDIDFYQLIFAADEIVYGEIIEMNETTYLLKIEENLTSDKEFIIVRKYEDFPCRGRWSEYELNQKLFLFLECIEDEYFDLFDANQGELPIVGESVYLDGFILPADHSKLKYQDIKEEEHEIFFDKKHYEVYGREYWGLKHNLKSFVQEVKFIKNNITYEKYIFGRKYRCRRFVSYKWTLKCSEKEFEKRAENSKIIRLIYANYCNGKKKYTETYFKFLIQNNFLKLGYF